MTYGTFKAAGNPDHNCSEMTCFKYLFYSCCPRFRSRRSSLKGSAVRKLSITSSSCTGDGGISTQSSSHVPDGGSSSTRSRPHESFRSLSEDEALITSTPRTEIVSYGSSNAKLEESSVPMIHVLDCSEDKSEEPVESVFEKVSVVKKDSNVEKVSVCSNRSQTSSPILEGEVEDVSETSKKSSIRTEDYDMENLPAYQSQSVLSTSTEQVQDVSTADVTSGSADDEHFESVKVSGDILFGLSYNYKTAALEVHVKDCRNLSPVDVKKNRSDPYVKGYLLPDRSKTGKKKTKVKKHTLNPLFDEVLKFPVTISELERRTLLLSVWHSQFGRNDFLGEMMLPLGHGIIENYGYKRHALKERLGKNDSYLRYNGDISLALKFVPSDSGSPQNQEEELHLDDNTKGELHVHVMEAKNLRAAYSNGTSNPFCKSYLLPEKNKTSKQKTAVVKKSCNPKWEHTFIYPDVTLSDLKERCLELTIWSHDKISSNNFLGGVRLSLGEGASQFDRCITICSCTHYGVPRYCLWNWHKSLHLGKYQGCDVEWMDSVGEEITLWDAMLHNSGALTEGCLLLRSQM